jgi:hypothetical protein
MPPSRTIPVTRHLPQRLHDEGLVRVWRAAEHMDTARVQLNDEDGNTPEVHGNGARFSFGTVRGWGSLTYPARARSRLSIKASAPEGRSTGSGEKAPANTASS